jgi:hypothetical protein
MLREISPAAAGVARLGLNAQFMQRRVSAGKPLSFTRVLRKRFLLRPELFRSCAAARAYLIAAVKFGAAVRAVPPGDFPGRLAIRFRNRNSDRRLPGNALRLMIRCPFIACRAFSFLFGIDQPVYAGRQQQRAYRQHHDPSGSGPDCEQQQQSHERQYAENDNADDCQHKHDIPPVFRFFYECILYLSIVFVDREPYVAKMFAALIIAADKGQYKTGGDLFCR